MEPLGPSPALGQPEPLSNEQRAQISSDLTVSTITTRGAVSAPQRAVDLPNISIEQVTISSSSSKTISSPN